jgi:hypothetical protein
MTAPKHTYKRGSGLGHFPASTTPSLNKKKSRHLIDDISFSKDFIVCLCAWKGAINDYQAHRKEMEPSARR